MQSLSAKIGQAALVKTLKKDPANILPFLPMITGAKQRQFSLISNDAKIQALQEKEKQSNDIEERTIDDDLNVLKGLKRK